MRFSEQNVQIEDKQKGKISKEPKYRTEFYREKEDNITHINLFLLQISGS
jgi:hypothetical protein